MNKTSGFSLLEMLVALMISGILVGVGGPALLETTRNARRTAALNELVRAIHSARSESIRTGEEVVLCARSADGPGCGAPGADWAAGWLAFVNRDRDRPAALDAGETVLLEVGPRPGARISGNRGVFRFLPFNRRSTNGTLTYCDSRGEPGARSLIVSYTGRPRVSDRDAGGRAVRCRG